MVGAYTVHIAKVLRNVSCTLAVLYIDEWLSTIFRQGWQSGEQVALGDPSGVNIPDDGTPST